MALQHTVPRPIATIVGQTRGHVFGHRPRPHCCDPFLGPAPGRPPGTRALSTTVLMLHGASQPPLLILMYEVNHISLDLFIVARLFVCFSFFLFMIRHFFYYVRCLRIDILIPLNVHPPFPDARCMAASCRPPAGQCTARSCAAGTGQGPPIDPGTIILTPPGCGDHSESLVGTPPNQVANPSPPLGPPEPLPHRSS